MQEKISYRWVVWIIAMIAQAVPWFLLSVWAIVGASIQVDMNLSMSQFGLIGSIMMLGPAVLSIPVGKLNARYGSKPLVAIGLLLAMLGTVLMTYSDSFGMLLAYRILQGLGFAFIWTPAQTLSAKWFTRDEMSTAAGGNIVGLGLGGIVALVSTSLVASIGWRTYLLAASGGMFFVLLLVLLLTSSSPERRGYASIEEQEKRLGMVSDAAASGAVGGSGSVWARPFLTCYLMWFLCMGLYTTFASWTPMVFQIKGWSLATGGYITALSLGLGVVALLAGGPISDRLGRRPVQVRVAALILAACYALVGFSMVPLMATIFAVVAGVMAYYWNAPYFGILGGMAPSGKLEMVMGTNNSFAAAGAVIVPYLMGAFTGSGDLKGLYTAFGMLLVLGLVMFGFTLFIRERPAG